MEIKRQPTIFSGIQPTGQLHIGNYLGAIKQFVELQYEYNSLFCIVDLHSITENFEPKDKPGQILDVAINYLACGINPEKSILFVQSHVKEHTELAWILNCLTPMAELNKMTQFKDKKQRQEANINVGLFDYPVLMAADILLYHATLIPVGEDQVQHVELTRKIAAKFNNRFGDYFHEPEYKLTKSARVMALNDPSKKMSKSMGPKSYIALSDSPDEIKDKIAKAVTDTGGGKSGSGGKNLLDLFEVLVDDEQITNKFREDYKNGELQYGKFKPMLANVIISALKPIQEKRRELEKNQDYVVKVLRAGAEKARAIAEATMKEVRERVGLIQ